MKLELFNGPTSPFGRMTKVAGIELGLDFKETVIDVYNATFLDQWNPLRQIPTLLVDDTQPIFDSLNICLFFDSLSTTNSLFSENDFLHKTRVALAIGIMEAGLSRQMEIIRSDHEKSLTHIRKMEDRMSRALDYLESNASNSTENTISMAQIATACALEYTSFRWSDDWKNRRPKLAVWLATFSRRDSMISSYPCTK